MIIDINNTITSLYPKDLSNYRLSINENKMSIGYFNNDEFKWGCYNIRLESEISTLIGFKTCGNFIGLKKSKSLAPFFGILKDSQTKLLGMDLGEYHGEYRNNNRHGLGRVVIEIEDYDEFSLEGKPEKRKYVCFGEFENNKMRGYFYCIDCETQSVTLRFFKNNNENEYVAFLYLSKVENRTIFVLDTKGSNYNFIEDTFDQITSENENTVYFYLVKNKNIGGIKTLESNYFSVNYTTNQVKFGKFNNMKPVDIIIIDEILNEDYKGVDSINTISLINLNDNLIIEDHTFDGEQFLTIKNESYKLYYYTPKDYELHPVLELYIDNVIKLKTHNMFNYLSISINEINSFFNLIGDFEYLSLISENNNELFNISRVGEIEILKDPIKIMEVDAQTRHFMADDYINVPFSEIAKYFSEDINCLIPHYLVIDTETTELFDSTLPEINQPRLIQIAYRQYSRYGTLLRKNDEIIKPEGFVIKENHISGITNENAINIGTSLENALYNLNEVIESSKVIVGHNLEFDIKILDSEFKRLNIETDILEKGMLCTMKIASNYFKIDYYLNLQKLNTKLFTDTTLNFHKAHIDAEVTSKCFWELKRLGAI